MIFIKRFVDLKIRYKLLLGYSAIFILIGALASTTIYHFVRQAIEANIESELQKSTTAILDMVRMAADVSIKNYLRAVAEKNRDIAKDHYDKFRRGEMTEAGAMAAARKVMLSQPIGKTGYIYCLTSHGIIDNHPHEALMGADLSRHGFIQEQKRRKVGYIEYDWQNPSESYARAKALYMTYFGPWDWIISASSYRSEFKELINVEDFRDIVMSLKFGRTGYSFVIDTRGKLILHPKLEGINILNEADAEGRTFVRELIKRRSGKITYSWKNPGESRRRDKLVIFNHIPEYDWIVASSSYLDEFYAPLKTIQRIFSVTLLLSLMLVLPLSWWISASITNPLRQLMDRFAEGAKGDATVRMSRISRDEVGSLARYFNSFMERLDRSRHYLQKIVDSMPSILVGVDLDGRITLFNREAEKRTGMTSRRVLGQPVGDIFDDFSRHHELMQRAIEQQKALKVEKVTHPAHKGRRWADIMVYPIVFNRTEGVVLRIDDVTARARMEAMMVQTEKMMSVGGLAAGMAHEINNPLGAMVQSTQNILRRISADLPANHDTAARCGVELAAVQCYLEQRRIIEFLEGIRSAGDKAAEIVENMLHFSRKSESHKAAVDLAELLDKAVSLAAHDYDLKKKYDFRRIHIAREFRADVGAVPCVATEIEQVVLNLLRNAAQAMAEREGDSTDARIDLRLYRQDDMAVIEVGDNGPGIDSDKLKRVFEPFFSTKEVGSGTGLGLSVSYFIITNNHGGTMEASSEPGRGARFTIRLPLKLESASEVTAA